MTEIQPEYKKKNEPSALTLGDFRRIFTANLAKLLTFMIERDAAPMIGRDGEVHKKGSLHFDGLAADIILTKNGMVLTETQDHYDFGTMWKSLDSRNCWGGDFKDNDGNHYSMMYKDRK